VATSPKPQRPSVPQFDEHLVNLYEDRYLPHADTVYRFAFALTLSLDAAYACVKSTYEQAAAKMPSQKHLAEAGVLPMLIETCWRVFQDSGFSQSANGQSAVSHALKSLGIEARASLAAVDIVGLSPADVAKIFTWSEVDVRRQLAGARRTLIDQKPQF
jgi:DNA-directed RNA polymerase specialized sigma24 family protein